jgi:hypothetical protein
MNDDITNPKSQERAEVLRLLEKCRTILEEAQNLARKMEEALGVSDDQPGPETTKE